MKVGAYPFLFSDLAFPATIPGPLWVSVYRGNWSTSDLCDLRAFVARNPFFWDEQWAVEPLNVNRRCPQFGLDSNRSDANNEESDKNAWKDSSNRHFAVRRRSFSHSSSHHLSRKPLFYNFKKGLEHYVSSFLLCTLSLKHWSKILDIFLFPVTKQNIKTGMSGIC